MFVWRPQRVAGEAKAVEVKESPAKRETERRGQKRGWRTGMKIRVMGTEAECQAAREYYRGLEKESGVKSVSISGNYPNRGSNTIFRVYVDVEYYDAENPSRALIQKRREK